MMVAMAVYDKGISWVIAAYVITWAVHLAYAGTLFARIRRAKADWDDINRGR